MKHKRTVFTYISITYDQTKSESSVSYQFSCEQPANFRPWVLKYANAPSMEVVCLRQDPISSDFFSNLPTVQGDETYKHELVVLCTHLLREIIVVTCNYIMCLSNLLNMPPNEF